MCSVGKATSYREKCLSARLSSLSAEVYGHGLTGEAYIANSIVYSGFETTLNKQYKL